MLVMKTCYDSVRIREVQERGREGKTERDQDRPEIIGWQRSHS